MKEYLLFIPFFIELFGDWYLIKNGRKDIPWYVRVIMILLVAIVGPTYLKGLVAASALFCFFDPALNVLRFGWSKWDYIGQTKNYDKLIGHWQDQFGLKSWHVLAVRVILFVVCLIYAV